MAEQCEELNCGGGVKSTEFLTEKWSTFVNDVHENGINEGKTIGYNNAIEDTVNDFEHAYNLVFGEEINVFTDWGASTGFYLALQDIVDDISEASYKEGYDDGYEDGFEDGVASVTP